MAEEKEKPLTHEDVRREIDKCRSKGEAPNFSNKEFEEGIDLRGFDLREVIFRDARFPTHSKRGREVGANLAGIHLEKADFARAHLERADLRDTHLEGAILWHAHLERATLWDTHLEEANLMSTHLQGANLTRTKFSPDINLQDVDWGNYILDEEKQGDFESAIASYRHLKTWYTHAGYSDIAAKFYYREKEANRKALKWCSRNLHHRGALEFIRALFGYGERWWNVVFSIETLILLFAFTYLAIAASWEWWQILLLAWIPGLIIWFAYLKFTTGLNWTWLKKAPFWFAGMVLLFLAFYFLSGLVTSRYIFWRYLYFSTVSFTALGYGEWAKLSDGLASDFIKGIGAFESLVGISMMALLLVTFFRKWTR